MNVSFDEIFSIIIMVALAFGLIRVIDSTNHPEKYGKSNK